MVMHKINSGEDNRVFIKTQSYNKTLKIFKKLKKSRGKVVHILGAPGAGKSANLYQGIYEADLNVYEVNSSLSNENASSKEVFFTLVHDLKNSLGVKTRKDAYKKLSQFDAVLFADQFHDRHLINPEVIGFSKWTRTAGFKSLNFYLICIQEYLRYYKEFHDINFIFQTAWRIRFRGQKYDIFNDFSIFSRIIIKILGKLFYVVEISYSRSEIINIVKAHLDYINNEKLEECIEKYGYRPRFILDNLEC
jgi:hypothetical protein